MDQSETWSGRISAEATRILRAAQARRQTPISIAKLIEAAVEAVYAQPHVEKPEDRT